jgi:hypothetical protein
MTAFLALVFIGRHSLLRVTAWLIGTLEVRVLTLALLEIQPEGSSGSVQVTSAVWPSNY